MEVQRILADRIGHDIDLISISLDPETDTPEVLAEYAELYEVGDGWTFYTGDLDEITELRHRLGAFDPDPVVDADRTQHAGILTLGHEAKGRWCALPGELPARALARSLVRVMDL